MRSVYDGVLVAKAISPVEITGTGTPLAAATHAIDTFGYNSGIVTVSVGTPTGTTIAFTIAIQVTECATSTGTYTNVSGATGTITGSSVAGNVLATIRLEGLGTDRERYLKVVPTVTMTPNDGSKLKISAVAVLGRAFKEPVGNSATGTGA